MHSLNKINSSKAKNLSMMGSVKIISIILSALTNIILARFLYPYDFGIVSIVMIVIGAAAQFNDFGLFSAAIQMKNTDEKKINTLFSLRIVIGISAFLILFAAAPWIAEILRIKTQAFLIQILSFQFVFSAFNYLPNIMLTRMLKFRLISIIQLINSLSYSLTAVILAILGFHFFSIIIAMVASFIATSYLYLFSYRSGFSFSFNFPLIEKELRFGFNTFIGNLLWFISTSIISISILYSVGVRQLGAFSVAYTWATFISVTFGPVLHTVLFPSFSKYQDDHDRIAHETVNILRYISFILLPALIGFFVIAEPFIILVLSGGSHKWFSIIPIFRFLIIYSLMQLFCIPLTTTMLSKGRSDIIVKINLLNLASYLIAIPVLTWYRGTVGTSIALIAGYTPTLIAYYYYSSKYVQLSVRKLFYLIKYSLLFSIVMGVAVYLVTAAMPLTYPYLASEILFGILLYIGLSYLFDREYVMEFLGVVLSVFT